MNKKKSFLIIFLSIITIFCAVYFLLISKNTENSELNNSPNNPNTSDEVRFYESQNLGYPFWIAEEKGFLTESGFDKSLKGVYLGSEANIVEWAKANLDVGILSLDELLRIEGRYPDSFKAIFFIYDTNEEYSSSLVVKKGSGLASVNDLSGKKIAVGTDTEEFLLKEYLEANGITDSQISRLSRKDYSEQLEKGSIDAVWVTEPYTSKLVLDGDGEILTNNPESDMSGAPYGVFVVNNDFYNRDPVMVESLKKALTMALGVTESEQREIMKEHLGEEWIQIVTDRTFAKISPAGEVDKSLLQKVADKMYENGFLDKKIETVNIF